MLEVIAIVLLFDAMVTNHFEILSRKPSLLVRPLRLFTTFVKTPATLVPALYITPNAAEILPRTVDMFGSLAFLTVATTDCMSLPISCKYGAAFEYIVDIAFPIAVNNACTAGRPAKALANETTVDMPLPIASIRAPTAVTINVKALFTRLFSLTQPTK